MDLFGMQSPHRDLLGILEKFFVTLNGQNQGPKYIKMITTDGEDKDKSQWGENQLVGKKHKEKMDKRT